MNNKTSALPRPLAVTCPKCGAKPGERCTALDDTDWQGRDWRLHWRLMPRTAHTLEAHLHVERFNDL